MEHNKKFIIIGNMNAVTHKEVFPLIRDNKMWLGVSRNGCGSMWFKIPDDANDHNGQKIENGIRMQTIGSSAWFTNLDHKKRHEPLDLYKRYTPEEFPKYDNYDAIEVSKVCDIPEDYKGIMGVPITFLGKYCPEQFEIIWTTDRGGDGMIDDLKVKDFDKSWDSAWINGNKVYKRIFIKSK